MLPLGFDIRKDLMPTKNKNKSDLVTSLATRLRLIQIDFADEDPQIRKGYLDDEIQRSLKLIDTNEKNDFLSELSKRFPDWKDLIKRESENHEGSVGDLSDPDFLLSEFIKLVPNITDQEKKLFSERIQNSGLLPRGSGQPSIPEEKSKRFTKALEVQELDYGKAFELLAMLVELVKPLDSTVRKICQEINKFTPARNRPPINFGKLGDSMKKYISGKESISTIDVEKSIGDLRVLIAVMLKAIPGIPAKYNSNHLEKIDPATISKNVKGNFLKSHDVISWEKYKEIYDEEGIKLFSQKMMEYFAEDINAVIEIRSRV